MKKDINKGCTKDIIVGKSHDDTWGFKKGVSGW